MPSVWMMDGLALIQFDSTTTAIINQTVPGVSPSAGGMALSPDGRRLYLVDPTTSIVQYRDSSTLGLVNSTTLGVASGVRQSYVSVDGTKLYVVDRGSGIIYLLDAFTLATITSTFLGNAPLNVVQTPDGTKLYIPQQGANRVLVLNPTTLATITTVAVGSAANWVQITNDGAKVYCVNIGGGTVSVIATASNTVTTTIAPPAGVTAAAYMSMSPTSDYLYVWEAARFVIPAPPPSTYLWKIDTATDTIAQTINPSPWIPWATPSSDNKYLWTTQNDYGTGPAAPIFNIPSLSSSSTITTPISNPSIMVAFSNPRLVGDAYYGPSGLGGSPGNGIVSVAADGSRTPVNIKTLAQPSGIAVSKDNSTVYCADTSFLGSTRPTLRSYDSSTGATNATFYDYTVTPLVPYPQSVDINPNDQYLYCTAIDQTTQNLYVQVYSTTTTLLVKNILVYTYPGAGVAAYGIHVSVAPDGLTAYVVDRTTSYCWVIDLTTNTVSPGIYLPASATGGHGLNMGISADSKTGYVIQANAGNTRSVVVVVNLVTKTITTTVTLSVQPTGGGQSYGGYTTCDYNNRDVFCTQPDFTPGFGNLYTFDSTSNTEVRAVNGVGSGIQTALGVQNAFLFISANVATTPCSQYNTVTHTLTAVSVNGSLAVATTKKLVPFTPNPPTQKFRPLLFVPRKGMSIWNPTDVDINWNAIERWASAMGFPVIFPFRSQSRMLTANELDANWHRMEIWAASSGVYPPPDNVIAPLLIQRKNSTAPQDLSINFLRIQDWANGQ